MVIGYKDFVGYWLNVQISKWREERSQQAQVRNSMVNESILVPVLIVMTATVNLNVAV